MDPLPLFHKYEEYLIWTKEIIRWREKKKNKQNTRNHGYKKRKEEKEMICLIARKRLNNNKYQKRPKLNKVKRKVMKKPDMYDSY